MNQELTPDRLRQRSEVLDRGMTAKGLNAHDLASLLVRDADKADMLAIEIAEARAQQKLDLLTEDEFCTQAAPHLGLPASAFGLADAAPAAPPPPVPRPERPPRKLSGPRRKNVQDPPPTSPASDGDRKELACTPEEIAALFADAVVIAFQAVNRDGTKEYFLRAERQIGEGELLSLLLRKP